MGEQTTNRRIARGVMDGFAEHDLLTYASAICFQILTALVPLLMFATALLGFLDLRAAWTQHIAPQVQDATSAQAFALIDDAVRRVLNHGQLTWLTLGLVLTVWEASGGIRATMDVLSRIYGGRDDRPRVRRYGLSFALSLMCTVLVVTALALVFVTPEVLPGIVWAVLRWPAAFLALLGFVWLLMRFAPCHPTPVHWVSFGAVLSAGIWLGATGLFAFYVARHRRLRIDVRRPGRRLRDVPLPLPLGLRPARRRAGRRADPRGPDRVAVGRARGQWGSSPVASRRPRLLGQRGDRQPARARRPRGPRWPPRASGRRARRAGGRRSGRRRACGSARG